MCTANLTFSYIKWGLRGCSLQVLTKNNTSEWPNTFSHSGCSRDEGVVLILGAFSNRMLLYIFSLLLNSAPASHEQRGRSPLSLCAFAQFCLPMISPFQYIKLIVEVRQKKVGKLYQSFNSK